jgi:iron(III) transport system ATP-binding protein
MADVNATTQGDGIVVENLSHSFGANRVLEDISLSIRTREIVTLLGPSGCGKTTTLRLIAGLEPLQQGRISLDGRVLADGDLNVPPEERSVSLLFQDFALFPHLTAIDNVIFGLGNWPPEERHARAIHVLGQVGMTEFADSYPHVLSGGQQQRVALARARGPRPRMMLMDEPFSNLDTTLRRQVRDMVLWVLQNSVSATLMVTHDPEDAMFMSDRIAVMEHGRIVQQGTPDELYKRPANAFVMSQFGEVNRLVGRVEAGHVTTPLGRVCAPGLAEGAPAEVMVRAEGLRLDPEAPARGRVLTTRILGGASLIHLNLPVPGADDLHLHARISGPEPAENDTVGLTLADEHVFVFPLEGEENKD